MPIIAPPSRQAFASYKTGYARSAAQSAHPSLWRGMTMAYPTGLGATGDNLHSAGRMRDGTLTAMDPATDWTRTLRGLSLDFDGTDDYVIFPGGIPAMNDTHWSISWRGRYDASASDTATILGSSSAETTRDNLRVRFITSEYYIMDWSFSDDTSVSGAYRIINGSDIAFIGEHYYTLTRNVDTFDLYIDGVNIVPWTDWTTSTATNDWTIFNKQGMHRSTNAHDPFLGLLGDMYVHNRILSHQEIRLLSSNSLAPFRRKRRFVGLGGGAPASSTSRLTLLGVG